MVEQHHHGDPLLLHQLPQGVGKDGGGADGGVPGLRVHAQDVPVLLEDLLHRAHQGHVGGEFPLAQAAPPLHDKGAAVVAIDGGDVVDGMGPGGDGAEVEVHEVHVVGQQDVRGLQPLHVDLFDLVLLPHHAQAAQGPEDGGKDLPLPQGRLGGVVAFEAAVVDVDALHMFPSLPPDNTFPAGIVTSLSQNRRESKWGLWENGRDRAQYRIDNRKPPLRTASYYLLLLFYIYPKSLY